MLNLNSHKDIAFPEIIKKYLKKYMETFAFNFHTVPEYAL